MADNYVSAQVGHRERRSTLRTAGGSDVGSRSPCVTPPLNEVRSRVRAKNITAGIPLSAASHGEAVRTLVERPLLAVHGTPHSLSDPLLNTCMCTAAPAGGSTAPLLSEPAQFGPGIPTSPPQLLLSNLVSTGDGLRTKSGNPEEEEGEE
ncbi:hypothetical protein EYF80_047454 [Liparis tanakae]|uniref:Uncharacterized protein n=1 Tax=Liparis tanakae TaxID=230148 RepID=A0A4Z2FML1_9TELE|nr:hypothetical protein EYF80_047454 [Liparis tanakae]